MKVNSVFSCCPDSALTIPLPVSFTSKHYPHSYAVGLLIQICVCRLSQAGTL